MPAVNVPPPNQDSKCGQTPYELFKSEDLVRSEEKPHHLRITDARVENHALAKGTPFSAWIALDCCAAFVTYGARSEEELESREGKQKFKTEDPTQNKGSAWPQAQHLII